MSKAILGVGYMHTCWILCMCNVLCALHASQLDDIPLGTWSEYVWRILSKLVVCGAWQDWDQQIRKGGNQSGNQALCNVHATTRWPSRWPSRSSRPSKPSSQPSNRVPAAESRKSCGRHFYRFVRGVFYRFVSYLPRAHIPNILTNLFYISVYFIFLSPRQWP